MCQPIVVNILYKCAALLKRRWETWET